MKYTNFDDYIEHAQDFAKPILTELRQTVHEACPEVSEEFKWSFPNFTYKGKILCNMASFKAHATFGFWMGSIMSDPHNLFIQVGETAMGQFGKITSLEDLPDRAILSSYILEAVQLIDEGKTLPQKDSSQKKEIIIPNALKEALLQNKTASATFDGFSFSHRKEYVEWIQEAKTEPTRIKRLNQTIEWLSEGKSRNWKYQKK